MKITTYIHQNIEIIIFIILSIILVSYMTYRSYEAFYNECHGLNCLDAIIYLNLENRPDRKEFIIKDLEKVKTDMSKVHKVSSIYIPKNGHKGCIQSHILAMKLAELNNWDKVLILEDDAEIKGEENEFNKTIDDILEKIKDKKWDVIMLGACNKIYNDDDKPTIDIHNNNKIRQIKSATCSHAYIINGNYRNRILTLFKECNQQMKRDKLNSSDFEPYALDQKWSTLQEKDNWYCLENDIVVQRAVWSNIMKETHSV